MKALHFGAGNIGRGFIGEVYYDNNFEIVFADVNDEIINQLNESKEIPILFAGGDVKDKIVKNVSGVNTKYDSVNKDFLEANIVSTSVGANNLKYLAEPIANGIKYRKDNGILETLDIIACENLINGTQILKKYVLKKADEETKEYIEKYIGFPNAAIDRIVPIYKGDNPLSVKVEEFKEWIIENKDRKSNIVLDSVNYVDNLQPFIERKLFTVNTGHASSAYLGLSYGYDNLYEALSDKKLMSTLKGVLQETGSFLCTKYGFNKNEHEAYINKVISRFQNKYIVDDLNRIARNPITKLGYNERFVRPLRELKSLNLNYDYLLMLMSVVFKSYNINDEESVELKRMFESMEKEEVVKQVTGIDDDIVKEIVSYL